MYCDLSESRWHCFMCGGQSCPRKVSSLLSLSLYSKGGQQAIKTVIQSMYKVMSDWDKCMRKTK